MQKLLFNIFLLFRSLSCEKLYLNSNFLRRGEITSSSNAPVVGPCGCGAYFDESALDCLMCPVNTYKPSIGGNSVVECLNCPMQTMSSAGACSCTPAPTHEPTAVPCSCGAYYDKRSKDCLMCPAGTYKPNIGGSNFLDCFTCPIGSTSYEGSCSCAPNESLGEISINNENIGEGQPTKSGPMFVQTMFLFVGPLLVFVCYYCFRLCQSMFFVVSPLNVESEKSRLCHPNI